METEYIKGYSNALGRDMECKVYGHAGRPVIYIPCQNGRFYDFEDFHMAGTLSPWIDSGQIQVLSIDTMDQETWSATEGDPYWRARRHEQWMNYIFNEMAPLIQDRACEKNGWDRRPGVIAMGCSLGATHAANLFFRRSDIFDGLLALSGIYTASYGFGDYRDEVVYMNSPEDYPSNMPYDHPYIEWYNRHKGVICVGTGAWEQPDSTGRVDAALKSRGINVWVDYWGTDVNHDWPWWYKQAIYFMPYLLS